MDNAFLVKENTKLRTQVLHRLGYILCVFSGNVSASCWVFHCTKNHTACSPKSSLHTASSCYHGSCNCPDYTYNLGNGHCQPSADSSRWWHYILACWWIWATGDAGVCTGTSLIPFSGKITCKSLDIKHIGIGK